MCTRHPIAEYLDRQWSIFKSMQEDAIREFRREPRHLSIGFDKDVDLFSNSLIRAFSSKDVGDVVTSFLESTRNDLANLNWGGMLDYKVSALGDTGSLQVRAAVDKGDGHPLSIMDINPFFNRKVVDDVNEIFGLMCPGSTAEKSTIAPFMDTYAKTHPIGEYFNKQWTTFKSMQEDAIKAEDRVPHDLKIGVDEGDAKHFFNSKSTACTFQEICDVGTSFLEFLKEELGRKNWGGKLHYKISTTGDTGFVHVAATVEKGDGHPPSIMDIKPFFHIK